MQFINNISFDENEEDKEKDSSQEKKEGKMSLSTNKTRN